MTTAGWFIMLVSIASVVTLAGFCYYKVLSNPASTDGPKTPNDTDLRGPAA